MAAKKRKAVKRMVSEINWATADIETGQMECGPFLRKEQAVRFCDPGCRVVRIEIREAPKRRRKP